MEYQVTQSYNGVEITEEQAHQIRLMNDEMKEIVQEVLRGMEENHSNQ